VKDVFNLTNQHRIGRQQHIEHLRSMLTLIQENISHVSSLQDLDHSDELVSN